MDRLFLDANVLFSAAYKGDARVRRVWTLKNVVLCTSRYALEEARINLADGTQHQRLSDLAENFQFFDAPDRALPREIALPDKDAPILLAALEARADFLLTGDFKHFGRYLNRKLMGLTVMLPGTYLQKRKH